MNSWRRLGLTYWSKLPTLIQICAGTGAPVDPIDAAPCAGRGESAVSHQQSGRLHDMDSGNYSLPSFKAEVRSAQSNDLKLTHGDTARIKWGPWR
jgi:hypothetical protein